MPKSPAKSRPHILTLDLGSTRPRAALVSVEHLWEETGEVSADYHIHASRGGDSLWQEYRPNQLRATLIDLVSRARALAGERDDEIIAISITAVRGGTAFLDAKGATVYVGPNTDLRAVFEGSAIDEELRDQVHAATGHLPSLFFAPAKLHWWREHHPRTARRIATILSLGAWAAYQLTSEIADTEANLVETGLLSVSDGKVPKALLDALEVRAEVLPPLLKTGEPLGGLARDLRTHAHAS